MRCPDRRGSTRGAGGRRGRGRRSDRGRHLSAASGAGFAAAVAAAALTLAGCSSDSSDDAQKEPVAHSATITGSTTPTPAGTGTATVDPAGAPSGTPSASGSAADADTGGASTDSTESVEGVWLATVDGTKVQLVLGKGKAGLTSAHLCGGAYTGTSSIRLTLTCMDGDKERTSGSGQMGPDGTTLTVQWTGGLTDTFSRTGLPAS